MKRSIAIAAVGLPALAGCGPTDQEIAALVLQALVPILLCGLLLQALYRLAWKRLDPASAPRLFLAPTLWLLGLSAPLLLASAVVVGRDPVADVLVAVWIAGTSYATFLGLSARATLRAPTIFSWAAAIPWALIAVPALYFLAFGAETDVAFSLFALPGYGGLVAGPLWGLLFAEVGVRALLARSRARKLEPVFPTARVVERDPPSGR